MTAGGNAARIKGYISCGGGGLYQKTTLDNGLRVVTARMPRIRSAAISIFVGTGSRYEDGAEAGVAHFIEHLCFKGTERRPSPREISLPIEGVGGILNAATSKELTVYWSKVALPHLPLALDVLTDITANARFDPEDIRKERQVIIEEIHMGRDNPAQRVMELFEDLLWPGHPLGRDIAGSEESLEGLGRARLMAFFGRHYQPANTVVAIAGDIRHREMVAAVRRATAGWSRQPRQEFSQYRGKEGQRLVIEHRATEQVQVCLGLTGVSLLDPRRHALDLLNVILGEGMSSRLFTEIRDRLGLVYSIQSYVDHLLDTGALVVTAGMDPGNLRATVKAVVEELARLKENVPEAELARAKELTKGRLLLRMEDSRNVAGWLGGQEVLTGRILTPDEIIALVDAVTAGEIYDVAREVLVGEKLRLAVVGPVAPDEPLEELLAL